jgi:NAD(P)H-hydrate repair Nnr-like enzyme with NAD(P)H-hydrate dehydratase domain
LRKPRPTKTPTDTPFLDALSPDALSPDTPSLGAPPPDALSPDVSLLGIHLPPIPPDANKYTRGSLLVLAGSKRYPGAAVLAALAAARAGAGYVTLATPMPVAASARAHLLSVPVIAAPATRLRSDPNTRRYRLAAPAARPRERPRGDGQERACEEKSRATRPREHSRGDQALQPESEMPPARPREYPAGVFAADALQAILAEQRHIDAILCGPGILTTPATATFVRTVIAFAAERNIPLLLDADALNILAQDEEVAQLARAAGHTAKNKAAEKPGAPAEGDPPKPLRFITPTILTPHGGEMARLNAAFATRDASALAAKLNAIVVAKGPTTEIGAPSWTRQAKREPRGRRKTPATKAGAPPQTQPQSARLACGTPALAKAGTGDVLSGIIGSLLAQGLSAWDAAVLGVALHGEAGRLAEQKLGIRSVMAEDVIAALPKAMRARE